MLRKIAILAALVAEVLCGQPSSPSIQFVTSDPAGACSVGVPLQYNTSNGKLWGCDAGTWATIGGGSSAPGFSGYISFSGATSGSSGFSVPNVAGTAILYLLPSTAGSAGQVLSDTGSVTCPTLPAGAPGNCHQMAWISAGGAPVTSNLVGGDGAGGLADSGIGFSGTSQVLAVSGTSSAPGYSFAAAAGTGLYYASNEIRFAIAGVGAYFRVTATNGVRISSDAGNSVNLVDGTNSGTLIVSSNTGTADGNVKAHSFSGGGAAPTITAGCNGAGSSIASGSTDSFFTVNTQTSAATTCTITFNAAFINQPICVATDANASIVPIAYSIDNASSSASVLKVDFASASSKTFNVMCGGH